MCCSAITFWTVNKKNVEDVFFLSLLYKKFIAKICYGSGLHSRVNQLVFFSVLALGVTRTLKKPFFFMFFHLFEKLSVNFALLSRRRGRRIYFIPAPIPFQSRYKCGLRICKKLFSGASENNVGFSREKMDNKVLFFFLSYVFKNKNVATAGVNAFKKKIKKNRVFAHWRWR
jgi:hypothetical protein